MWFNLHNGQMRIAATKDGKPTQMYYRKTSPKKLIIMGKIKSTEDNITYKANSFGNIEVHEPQHLLGLMQLGYPIYNGRGELPILLHELIFPNPILGDKDPHWMMIQQEIKEGITSTVKQPEPSDISVNKVHFKGNNTKLWTPAKHDRV